MELLQRVQVHFEQNGGTYLLVGTLFTTAWAVHARWGPVAVICFTVTAVGSYPYLRKQVDHLLHRNLDTRVQALLSVVVSVATIFSPTIGLCLGALMGSSFFLRDWTVKSLLEKGEKEIATLKEQNQEWQTVNVGLQNKLETLQVEYNQLMAAWGGVKNVVKQHLETQGGVVEASREGNNQSEGLEIQLNELVELCKVMEISKKSNIGPQVTQITNSCEEKLRQIQNDREKLRALIERLEAEQVRK